MSRLEEALRRANHAVPAVETGCEDEYASETRGAVAFSPAVGERPSSSQERLEAVPDEPEHGDFNPKLIVSPTVAPHAVEQYRKLAASLYQVNTERGTRVIMVSSAVPGEGKSLTAANLALTLSESFRRKVILIDADLRRPAIHEMFDISNQSGLNDTLTAGEDMKLRLIKVSPYLTVLPAGPANPDPMGSLISDRMRRIVEEAAATYEWVVLDTPPVGLLPDANLLAEMADMILFVVGAGTTPYTQVQRAMAALDRNRVVGVVLNRAVDSKTATQQYYGYYNTRPAGH